MGWIHIPWALVLIHQSYGSFINELGYCPHNWTEHNGICYSVVSERVSYKNAFEQCFDLNGDYFGSYFMPLSLLRSFETNEDWMSGRLQDKYYRINAYFDEYTMQWKEYPSEKVVDFKNFPTFGHQNHARHGSTLVWNPFNAESLKMASPHEDLPALCYRSLVSASPYYRCEGYPGYECSNAGDCIDGSCECDPGFSGNNCEVSNGCYNDCNGNGACRTELGTCHCPGFKGAACEFCRTGLVEEEGYLDCYIISHQKMLFDEALRWCTSQYIPMAEARTMDDALHIYEKIRKVDQDDHFWIGASNRQGQFAWEGSGLTLDETFTNWAPQEPDLVEGNNDCVSVSSIDGMWFDRPCSHEYRAVCQYRFQKFGPFNLATVIST